MECAQPAPQHCLGRQLAGPGGNSLALEPVGLNILRQEKGQREPSELRASTVKLRLILSADQPSERSSLPPQCHSPSGPSSPGGWGLALLVRLPLDH